MTSLVLADFTISIESEIPREVRVIVYDSLKGLRIAATRYANLSVSRRKKKLGLFANTLGVCHRFECVNHDGEVLPLCAIIRLAKPYVGVGILSHEMAHAAVWLHELNQGTTILNNHNDEPFAWYLGELVRQTVNAMNDRGVYDDKD